MNDVEEVKSRIDIAGLVGEYVTLKKAGRNYKANCPFHGEKTPSFMVSPELSIYKCFGCGEGGDAISFLMRMEGMEFGEALRFLAKRVGVKLSDKGGEESGVRQRLVSANKWAGEYYHYLLTKREEGKEALEYLVGRGVGKETIEVFGLGWAPEGWDSLGRYLTLKKKYSVDELVRAGLVGKSRGGKVYDRFRRRVVFPLRNHRGDVLGFSGRILPGDPGEGEVGKYINTSETEIYKKGELLYGLDVTRGEVKREGKLVVVEGELDMISVWQVGVGNVVAIKGSALTERQVELVRKFAGEVILALDSDAAGDMAMRRGVWIADKAGLIVRVARMGNYKDPDEYARGDPEGLKKSIASAEGVYDFFLESAVSRYEIGSAVGKKRVADELLPIWREITDEIVRAHYVKRLAEVLGVDETVVVRQMEKIVVGVGVGESGNKEVGVGLKIAGRELKEEYLLALGMALGVERLLVDGVRGVVRGHWAKRVIEELGKYCAGHEGFVVKNFFLQMPEELKERMGRLMLYEFPDDKVWMEKEMEKKVGELVVLGVREDQEVLTREIKLREGRGEDVTELQKKFAEMSRQLTSVVY